MHTMRNTELQVRAVVSAAALAVLVGCGGGSGDGRRGELDDAGNAFVFQIAAATNALEPGQSLQLRMVVQDADLRDLNVRLVYSSSQSDVATVSANGLVTALQPGTTQITVESPGGPNSRQAMQRLFVQHPVRNKIAFVSIRGPLVGFPPSPAGGIYLMNPDGSEQQLLAPSVVDLCTLSLTTPDRCPKHWTQPSWNRDGMRLATSSFRFIELERAGTLIFLCSTVHPECDRLEVYPPIQHPAAPFPQPFPLIAFDPSWSPQGDRLTLSRGLWSPSEHLLSEWSRREPDWSPDGTRIVHVVDGLFITTLADSGLVRLTGPDTRDENPAWSPDGAHIAFATDRDGNFEIYLYRLSDGALTNLTNAAGDDRFPTWSPDSTRIAFQSNRDGNDEIYSMQADGSSPMNLTNNPAPDREPAWSRN